jgi:hypothetical protein
MSTPFVKLFEDVVEAVSDEILADLQADVPEIVSIAYKYGYYNEIAAYIKDRKNAPGTIDPNTGAPTGVGGKFDLMPLVVLFMPFMEDRAGNGGYPYKVTVDIGIFYFSDKESDTETRYTEVFEKVLLPIYDCLLDKIIESGLFAALDVRELSHKKIDLPFGTNDDGNGKANIFGELLDAVKINGLSLTVV